MTAAPALPAERPTRARLLELAARRFAESTAVPTQFFDAHADAISAACLAMARRFHGGGRLLVFGEGAEATDAQHVAVEFVHPVIVGKRALPALSLASDVAALTGVGRSAQPAEAFARVLEVLGRPADIAMGISRGGRCAPALLALTRARELGMLTVALGGGGVGHRAHAPVRADFLFVVPSADPMVVQEVHETLYHVLWELVHVFFEQQVVQ